jgi:hypothetical protein
MISEQEHNRDVIHFALHSIQSDSEFEFIPEEYSKFKHGAVNIARKYGYEMAERFIFDCFSKNYNGAPIVIMPSAYSHIPTASFYMRKYFADKLNDYLFDNNYPVLEETKIHRTVSYREDYGKMSAEQRYELIKNDEFYVDQTFIGNKTLLLLDDIKITGTHEQIIINLLNKYKLFNTCYMLYFAELSNPKISPDIENKLNYAYVKSLDEIDTIIKNEDFRFNTRVVKYILNGESNCFDNFIAKQNKNFIEDLYYNAIGNEYFKFPVYHRNLCKIKSLIN